MLKNLFQGDNKKQQVRSYLKDLGMLAASDGKLKKSEITLLYRTGKKNGLKPDEVREIIKDDEDHYQAPDNDDERFEQLFNYIVMIMADGEIKEKEVDLCKDLAERLGIRKAACPALVDVISKRLGEGADKDTIRAEVSNFLYLSVA